jgi:hypothetical protein
MQHETKLFDIKKGSIMAKKLNKELKQLIESQIDIEGFDYAMTEKVSPDDWEEGVWPDDLKEALSNYLSYRQELKDKLEHYGIDPQ